MQPQDKTLLERAWLQTWILGPTRQDRAVFHFHTDQSSVVVRLPADVDRNQIEMRLDGQTAATAPVDSDRLSVAVDGSQGGTSHTLELRYQRPAPSDRFEVLRVEPVRLECRPTGAHVFWQLVLPGYLHVTSDPPGLAPESWLGWDHYRWGRQPTHDQPYLEQWSGAEATPPPPPALNAYLFSAFEIPESIEVTVTARSWLVFLGSAVVFGFGLLLLYTRLKQSPLFWLCLVTAVFVLVATRPEVAVIASVSILVGGVMTLGTMILRSTMLGAAGMRKPRLPSSSVVLSQAGVTQPWTPPGGSAFSEEETTTAMHASESR